MFRVQYAICQTYVSIKTMLSLIAMIHNMPALMSIQYAVPTLVLYYIYGVASQRALKLKFEGCGAHLVWRSTMHLSLGRSGTGSLAQSTICGGLRQVEGSSSDSPKIDFPAFSFDQSGVRTIDGQASRSKSSMKGVPYLFPSYGTPFPRTARRVPPS
ncbi:hypothetical protein F4604DRAFT_686099 [Suillus subluteus]|nr:hypothetical protein F4604DRAFT_686099 [Suillus subluteus]